MADLQGERRTACQVKIRKAGKRGERFQDATRVSRKRVPAQCTVHVSLAERELVRSQGGR